MSGAVANVSSEDTMKKAKEYLALVGQNVPQEEAKRFLEICRAFNLNPFKREIYLIPYGKQANIIVGYEVYLKRAERSGKLAGWRVWTEGKIEDGSLKACIEIRRKDWSEPFYHEVYFSEYKQETPIWKSKPLTMIKKVAIAQGFRLAFPEELGGLPYTQDEIDEISSQPEVIEAEIEQPKKEEKKITIDEIRRIIKPELKKIFSEKKWTTQQILDFWEKWEGNQDKMISQFPSETERRDHE